LAFYFFPNRFEIRFVFNAGLATTGAAGFSTSIACAGTFLTFLMILLMFSLSG